MADLSGKRTLLVRHKLFKTRLCKHFARGLCLYGDFCGFSHGENHEEVSRLKTDTQSNRNDLTGLLLDFEQGETLSGLFSPGSTEDSRRSLVDEMFSGRSRSLSTQDIEKIFEGW